MKRLLFMAVLVSAFFASCKQPVYEYKLIEICNDNGCKAVKYGEIFTQSEKADTIAWVGSNGTLYRAAFVGERDMTVKHDRN